MKILLAVDGSPYTRKMLDYLASHDEMLGPEHQYSAITVQTALPPRARGALSRELVQSYYDDEAEAVMQPVREFLARKGVQVQTIAKVGLVAETIAALAESTPFDLIVMGTQGHGALGKLVMGSVSTKVLAKCSVPVLLVR
ncbi:universal stress protein [Comamonas sp. NLF-1-9]|uniref:universal stress protein n=1 Tax=Comamonas sp. NLF-1-9 TaxID=2853163 RepID=UPI001C471747|nr:universal stress protein [Comamonas sp. NLF-1-9]QXL83935.1 universal stress protein [Comamonas sp. NLF-1-9]